jgi:hypothetical protein
MLFHLVRIDVDYDVACMEDLWRAEFEVNGNRLFTERRLPREALQRDRDAAHQVLEGLILDGVAHALRNGGSVRIMQDLSEQARRVNQERTYVCPQSQAGRRRAIQQSGNFHVGGPVAAGPGVHRGSYPVSSAMGLPRHDPRTRPVTPAPPPTNPNSVLSADTMRDAMNALLNAGPTGRTPSRPPAPTPAPAPAKAAPKKTAKDADERPARRKIDL